MPLAACNEVAKQFVGRCKAVTNGSPECSCAASTVADMMGDQDFEVLTLILLGQRGAAETTAARMGMKDTVTVTGKWSLVAMHAGRICDIVGLDRM